jgi:aminoglycoside phosphotransferase (APT) family kinase protein
VPDGARHVGPDLVRALLDDLPHHLGHLRAVTPVFVAEGWDNSIWRVGDRLAARIPHRRVAATLLDNEARWLPRAAAPLAREGVRVPIPLHYSPAGRRHTYPWLLVTWVEGTLVADLDLSARAGLTTPLARALRRLHRPAPPDAPHNPFRATPLDRLPPPSPGVVTRARELLGDDAVAGLLGVHRAGAAAPPWPGPPLWVHGDLHPRNAVRTPEGGLGLLDFGDLTAADPAVDLGVLWTAFDEEQRGRCLRVLGDQHDDHVQDRARGWAARTVLGIAGHQVAGFEPALLHTVGQLLD